MLKRRRPGLNPGLRRLVASRVLRGSNVLRLHALTSLGRLVGYLGALVEGLEALSRYAVVVDEDFLATLIRRESRSPSRH